MICNLCNHEHLTPLQCGTLHCNCVTELIPSKEVEHIPETDRPLFKFLSKEEREAELFRVRVVLNGGIDPYAPTTEFTKQKKIPICDRCKIDHPSNTLYDCEHCKGLRCCSQVYPHYDDKIETIQYYCCALCDNKVTVTHFEHGKIKT